MVDNGEFLQLTCRPKLVIKEATYGNDHIDLETIYDSQSHLALEISKSIYLPYQFPVLNKYAIVQAIYGWTNGVWTPGGLPAGDAYGKITFRDTNSGSTKEAHLFGIISTWPDPYEYDPLLATDVGLVVQKDFAAGGYIATQQGEVWIGHGRATETDVPKIILKDTSPFYTNPEYDTLYIRKFNQTPAHMDLGNLTAHGTVTATAFYGPISKIRVLSNDPTSPQDGEIWIRS